jgi:hypothetical protein
MNNIISTATGCLSALAPQSPHQLSAPTQKALRKQGEQIMANTMLSALEEDAFAFLAGRAANHVAQLSAEEALLANAIPNAAGRLSYLIDQYALSAARRISGR